MAPGLLALPAELRLRIYQLLFDAEDLVFYADPQIESLSTGDARPTFRKSLKSQTEWATRHGCPIIQSCKKVSEEVISFLHDQVPVLFDARYMTTSVGFDSMQASIGHPHADRVRHLIIDWRDQLCVPTPDACQLHAVEALPSLRKLTIKAHIDLGKILDRNILDRVLLGRTTASLWDLSQSTVAQTQVTQYLKTLWQAYSDYGAQHTAHEELVEIRLSLDLGWFGVVLHQMLQPNDPYIRDYAHMRGSVFQAKAVGSMKEMCVVSFGASVALQHLHAMTTRDDCGLEAGLDYQHVQFLY